MARYRVKFYFTLHIIYFSFLNFLSFYILIALIKTIVFRGKKGLFSLLEDKEPQRCGQCFHLTYSCLKLQHCHGISKKMCDVHKIQLYGSCEYLEAVDQMWLVTTFRAPQCVFS
jgi:hypothetical protein